MSNKNDRKKDGNNYFYTLSDMLIWDKPEEGTTYIDRKADIWSDEKNISNDTVYIDRFLKTGIGVWEGVRYIEDFVDIDALKAAMRKYGLALPSYIFFMEPGIIKRGASGWTSTLATDIIQVNIALVRERQELNVVRTIAHETYHLEKQPLLLRGVPGIKRRYEGKAGQIDAEVLREYIYIVYEKKLLETVKKRRKALGK